MLINSLVTLRYLIFLFFVCWIMFSLFRKLVFLVSIWCKVAFDLVGEFRELGVMIWTMKFGYSKITWYWYSWVRSKKIWKNLKLPLHLSTQIFCVLTLHTCGLIYKLFAFKWRNKKLGFPLFFWQYWYFPYSLQYK